jgi:peptidyl-prolyl cis-trans isomerase D
MLQKIHDSWARWVILVLMGFISLGFIFWRADFNTGGSTFAAKVNGETITLNEFDRELQTRQNRYQQQYRTDLSEDTRRQLRQEAINALVSETALRQRVEDRGYRISNQRLIDSVHGMAAFQVDGKFNVDTYRALLANQGYTPASFEALERDDLEVRELQDGLTDSTFLTPAEFRRYIELFNQSRDLGYATFDVQAFTNGVQIDDAAITEHYDKNKARYQTVETVDLQYIELTLADIAAKIEVSDEALHEYYDKTKDRYTTEEQRHARHILIAVNDKRTDEQAKALAEKVLARLKNGEDFAKVAAEVSDDVGSKNQGGDLGWISRGSFGNQPFEDALFSMKVGELKGPVKTDFGYHIIRLDELRPGGVQSFEAVHDQLLSDYRSEKAEDKFYDLSNQLEQKAFDAYNELTTVAKAMDLPLKTAMGFPRSGDPKLFENSAPVVQAAFNDEIVDNGKNSSLVMLADDDVLVLRVSAHHPPVVKPLDAVHDQIKQELTRERAAELAEQAADKFLAEADKAAGQAVAGDTAGGPAVDPKKLAEQNGGTWTAMKWVQRSDTSVPTQVLAAAFGVRQPQKGEIIRKKVALANGGYVVIAVDGVKPGDPASVPQTERDQRQRQLADQSAYAELTSYVDEVRDEASVRVPDSTLEPQ